MTGRGLSLIPAVCAALTAFVALPALAQETLYLGRKPGAVTIDQSVLEELGSPPTLPELLKPGRVQAAPVAPSGPVHLMPPAKGKKTAKAKAARHEVAALKEPKAPREAKGAKTNPPPPSVAAAGKGAPFAEVPPPPPPASPMTATPAATSPAAMPTPMTPASPIVPPASHATAAAPPPVPPAAPAATAQAVPPAPPPAAAPSPPAQTASRGPGVTSLGAEGVRITYDAAQTDLTDAAKQALSGVAEKMQADEQLRLQLVAYASGSPDQASQARRTSLSRALAARTFLMEKGVRSTRIDVRALGNTGDDPRADRVDALIAKR